MLNNKTAVAIFCFNRPEKVLNLLNSLKLCKNFEKFRYFVFVDGPRNSEDIILISKTLHTIRNANLPNLTVYENDKNKGLRNSIFHGVNKVLENFESAIVLEDDLILSTIALEYFEKCLNFYEKFDNVWSVCGYIYDCPSLYLYPKTIILPMSHSWGWATWKRSWEKFELDAVPSDEIFASKSFKKMLDVTGLILYTKMLKSSKNKIVNSWYAHWNYTIFRNRGFSVFPPVRVVENGGIGAGTHGGAFNPFHRLTKPAKIAKNIPEMEDNIEINYVAIDKLKKTREARAHRLITHLGYIKRRLKSIL